MGTKFKSRTQAGVNKKSKISGKLIAAIIVSIVAIAGIVIVFSSFASGPPAYQYQYTSTCEKKTTTIGGVTVPYDSASDCVKDSAEAMTYRMYAAATGKVIDAKNYQDYVQRMVGDRIVTSQVTPDSLVNNSLSNKDFIISLYKNVLYRTPAENEVNYWLNEISKNKPSRKDLIYKFAATSEAKNSNTTKFATFIKNNPTALAIVPIAQNQQNARTESALAKLKEMNAQKDALIADKNALMKINNTGQTKQYTDRISLRMIAISRINTDVQALAKQSQALTSYATNISDTDVTNYAKLANAVVGQAWTASVDSGNYAYSLAIKAAKAIKDSQQRQAALKRAEADKSDAAKGKKCAFGDTAGISQKSIEKGQFLRIRLTNLVCDKTKGQYKFTGWSNWVPASSAEWGRVSWQVPFEAGRYGYPPAGSYRP